MPVPSREPRLWLRPERGKRRANWIILHRGKQYATGYAAHQEAEAKEALALYLRDVFVPVEPFAGMKLSTARHYGFVYFISSNDVPNFPIKIGYAKSDADVRLKALQTGCPYNLFVLATIRGSQGTETRLHDKFAVTRIRGEWFQRSHDLMRVISLARQKGVPADTETKSVFRPDNRQDLAISP